MKMPKRIGRYEIIKRLGDPGLSDVYLARDYSADRQIIIKRLREEDIYREDFRSRFQQEAKILAKFRNAPVVPIFDFNELDDQPYIVMPYLTGGTLQEKLNGRPLPFEQLVPILERIAEALDIAHKEKIIHRDIKPNNILFDEDGKAYLSDFGLSKRLDASRPITQTADALIGTVLYMSPEQITNPGNIDRRSDIYSLAVILHEMLTGRHPFVSTSDVRTPNPFTLISIINKKSPPKLSNRELEELGLPIVFNKILQKALAKNPDDRYDSAGDLAKAVASLQDSVVVTPFKIAKPAPWYTRAVYWFARVLDKVIYRKTANEFQFRRLTQLASFSALFFGYILGMSLRTPLSNIDLGKHISSLTLALSNPTPTPVIYETSVIRPSLCYLGPDERYYNEEAKNVYLAKANTSVSVLATVDNPYGEWFMVEGVMVEGTSPSRCWMRADALSRNDFEDIVVFTTVSTKTGAGTSCRVGPGSTYNEQTLIPQGWKLVAYAVSYPSNDWIQVVPHDSTRLCWVSRNTLTEFSLGDLPKETLEPTITPTLIKPSSIYTFSPTSTSTTIPTDTRRPALPTPTNTRPSSGGGNDNPTPTPKLNTPGGPSNTPVPPTPVPPTSVPPTSVPPTSVPPTSVPPTSVPPTSVPPTSVPPTSVPTLCWPPGKCK